ncbi:TraR/DksA family transcriptional regulator [Microbacterium sp.]|uniref:TraR/DksA family transcriptional regulator n=1 Tax=Microbacterium sp. TaxID=51671 RepID=UPI003F728B46
MTDARAALEARRQDAVARLAHLDEVLAGLRQDRGADSADDEHDPEGATLSGEWSRLEGLRAEAAREITEADAALARVADGSYGICADCGRVIPPTRLAARPDATRCVTCAERAGA